MGRKERALDERELRVLRLICQNGRAHSSVWIAAELYGAQEEELSLEHWDVELCLETLNERGLINYRLSDAESAKGLIVSIRPTRAAYDVAKVEFNFIRIVGQYQDRRSLAKHSTDGTDFRNFGYTAGPAPVEKMSFEDHVLKYIEHADCHFGQYEELHEAGKV
jgi:hypothetical protein